MGLIFDVVTRRAKKVNVSVTDRCNLRCSICGIWRRPPVKELTVEDYEEFFKRNDWHWVSFTGGEPFLREDLLDVMRLPTAHCPSLDTISVTTNGVLRNKILKVVSAILGEKDFSSFYVSISLDGLRAFHDSQRGVKGSFENATKTFSLLRDELDDKRLKVHYEYVISKQSQGNLMNVIESLGLTPNDFIVTVAQKSYFYSNEEYSDIEPEREVLISEIGEFLKKYKLRSPHEIAQKVFLDFIVTEKRIPCVGGINSFHADCAGNVHPCIINPKIIGNIHDFRIMNPACFKKCYTPCEGYFSLLLNWRKALWSLI